MKNNIYSVRVCTRPATAYTVEYKKNKEGKITIRTYTLQTVPPSVFEFCTGGAFYSETISPSTTVYYSKEAKEAADLKEWKERERAVTLTNDQWTTLTCYILMSTQHRKGEREAWEKLAAEKNDDGTPTFKNAASNAEYYAELDAKLDAIRAAIDGI